MPGTHASTWFVLRYRYRVAKCSYERFGALALKRPRRGPRSSIAPTSAVLHVPQISGCLEVHEDDVFRAFERHDDVVESFLTSGETSSIAWTATEVSSPASGALADSPTTPRCDVTPVDLWNVPISSRTVLIGWASGSVSTPRAAFGLRPKDAPFVATELGSDVLAVLRAHLETRLSSRSSAAAAVGDAARGAEAAAGDSAGAALGGAPNAASPNGGARPVSSQSVATATTTTARPGTPGTVRSKGITAKAAAGRAGNSLPDPDARLAEAAELARLARPWVALRGPRLWTGLPPEIGGEDGEALRRAAGGSLRKFAAADPLRATRIAETLQGWSIAVRELLAAAARAQDGGEPGDSSNRGGPSTIPGSRAGRVTFASRPDAAALAAGGMNTPGGNVALAAAGPGGAGPGALIAVVPRAPASSAAAAAAAAAATAAAARRARGLEEELAAWRLCLVELSAAHEAAQSPGRRLVATAAAAAKHPAAIVWRDALQDLGDAVAAARDGTRWLRTLVDVVKQPPSDCLVGVAALAAAAPTLTSRALEAVRLSTALSTPRRKRSVLCALGATLADKARSMLPVASELWESDPNVLLPELEAVVVLKNAFIAAAAGSAPKTSGGSSQRSDSSEAEGDLDGVRTVEASPAAPLEELASRATEIAAALAAAPALRALRSPAAATALGPRGALAFARADEAMRALRRLPGDPLDHRSAPKATARDALRNATTRLAAAGAAARDAALGALGRTVGLRAAAAACALLGPPLIALGAPEEALADLVAGRWASEVESMQREYERDRASPPAPRGMPPLAGAVAWARALRMRLREATETVRARWPDALARRDIQTAVAAAEKLEETLLACESAAIAAATAAFDACDAALAGPVLELIKDGREGPGASLQGSVGGASSQATMGSDPHAGSSLGTLVSKQGPQGGTAARAIAAAAQRRRERQEGREFGLSRGNHTSATNPTNPTSTNPVATANATNNTTANDSDSQALERPIVPPGRFVEALPPLAIAALAEARHLRAINVALPPRGESLALRASGVLAARDSARRLCRRAQALGDDLSPEAAGAIGNALWAVREMLLPGLSDLTWASLATPAWLRASDRMLADAEALRASVEASLRGRVARAINDVRTARFLDPEVWGVERAVADQLAGRRLSQAGEGNLASAREVDEVRWSLVEQLSGAPPATALNASTSLAIAAPATVERASGGADGDLGSERVIVGGAGPRDASREVVGDLGFAAGAGRGAIDLVLDVPTGIRIGAPPPEAPAAALERARAWVASTAAAVRWAARDALRAASDAGGVVEAAVLASDWAEKSTAPVTNSNASDTVTTTTGASSTQPPPALATRSPREWLVLATRGVLQNALRESADRTLREFAARLREPGRPPMLVELRWAAPISASPPVEEAASALEGVASAVAEALEEISRDIDAQATEELERVRCGAAALGSGCDPRPAPNASDAPRAGAHAQGAAAAGGAGTAGGAAWSPQSGTNDGSARRRTDASGDRTARCTPSDNEGDGGRGDGPSREPSGEARATDRGHGEDSTPGAALGARRPVGDSRVYGSRVAARGAASSPLPEIARRDALLQSTGASSAVAVASRLAIEGLNDARATFAPFLSQLKGTGIDEAVRRSDGDDADASGDAAFPNRSPSSASSASSMPGSPGSIDGHAMSGLLPTLAGGSPAVPPSAGGAAEAPEGRRGHGHGSQAFDGVSDAAVEEALDELETRLAEAAQAARRSAAGPALALDAGPALDALASALGGRRSEALDELTRRAASRGEHLKLQLDEVSAALARPIEDADDVAAALDAAERFRAIEAAMGERLASLEACWGRVAAERAASERSANVQRGGEPLAGGVARALGLPAAGNRAAAGRGAVGAHHHHHGRPDEPPAPDPVGLEAAWVACRAVEREARARLEVAAARLRASLERDRVALARDVRAVAIAWPVDGPLAAGVPSDEAARRAAAARPRLGALRARREICRRSEALFGLEEMAAEALPVGHALNPALLGELGGATGPAAGTPLGPGAPGVSKSPLPSKGVSPAPKALTSPPLSLQVLEVMSQQLAALETTLTLRERLSAERRARDSLAWGETPAALADLAAKASAAQRDVRKVPKAARGSNAFAETAQLAAEAAEAAQLIEAMQAPELAPRHWTELARLANEPRLAEAQSRRDARLGGPGGGPLAALRSRRAAVRAVTERASREAAVAARVAAVAAEWSLARFKLTDHRGRAGALLEPASTAALLEGLEEALQILSSAAADRSGAPARAEALAWQLRLTAVGELARLWLDVQGSWTYLEAAFRGGEVSKALPREARAFSVADRAYLRAVAHAAELGTCVRAAAGGGGAARALLGQASTALEACRRGLGGYLEERRAAFPRFAFLSDASLLAVLSAGSDPVAASKHFGSGLFEGVASVAVDRGEPWRIVALKSGDGETLPLDAPGIDCRRGAESWLAALVPAMRRAVRRELARAVRDLRAGQDLEAFLTSHPAQACLAALHVIWTDEQQDALINSSRDPGSLSRAARAAATRLRACVAAAGRPGLARSRRAHLESCACAQLRLAESSKELVDRRAKGPGDHEWLGRQRHRWDDRNARLFVSVGGVEFEHGYEYSGARERLVATPLTETACAAMARALSAGLGASPTGPAGTGKTETVKDLGATLGRLVVVFNCSDQMDGVYLGRIFRGLAQAGAWGCFDEFNRVEADVLSVCAQQLGALSAAARTGRTSAPFPGGPPVRIDRAYGVFATMNPGYAGRHELPESLKPLFRPVAMGRPDVRAVARARLAAGGFSDHDRLAGRLQSLYEACKLALRGAPHYDFGLRSVLAVLRTAAEARRVDPEGLEALGEPSGAQGKGRTASAGASGSKASGGLNAANVPERNEGFGGPLPEGQRRLESSVLAGVIADLNVPRLVGKDASTFAALLNEAFPDARIEKPRVMLFEDALLAAVRERGLLPSRGWWDRCLQLRGAVAARHGVAVVGPAGSGKTTLIECVASAFSRLNGSGRPILFTFPRALPERGFLGHIDRTTGEWRDGYFAAHWRRAAASAPGAWLLADGPVDAGWIEDLNTALDDSKVLTLPGGDRIALLPGMRIVVEAEDMLRASAATASRLGTVAVEPEDLGWRHVLESWATKGGGGDREALRAIVERIAGGLLDDPFFFRGSGGSVHQRADAVLPTTYSALGNGGPAASTAAHEKAAAEKAASTQPPPRPSVDQSPNAAIATLTALLDGCLASDRVSGSLRHASAQGSEDDGPAEVPASSRSSDGRVESTATPNVESSGSLNATPAAERPRSALRERALVLHRLAAYCALWALGGFRGAEGKRAVVERLRLAGAELPAETLGEARRTAAGTAKTISPSPLPPGSARTLTSSVSPLGPNVANGRDPYAWLVSRGRWVPWSDVFKSLFVRPKEEADAASTGGPQSIDVAALASLSSHPPATPAHYPTPSGAAVALVSALAAAGGRSTLLVGGEGAGKSAVAEQCALAAAALAGRDGEGEEAARGKDGGAGGEEGKSGDADPEDADVNSGRNGDAAGTSSSRRGKKTAGASSAQSHVWLAPLVRWTPAGSTGARWERVPLCTATGPADVAHAVAGALERRESAASVASGGGTPAGGVVAGDGDGSEPSTAAPRLLVEDVHLAPWTLYGAQPAGEALRVALERSEMALPGTAPGEPARIDGLAWVLTARVPVEGSSRARDDQTAAKLGLGNTTAAGGLGVGAAATPAGSDLGEGGEEASAADGDPEAAAPQDQDPSLPFEPIPPSVRLPHPRVPPRLARHCAVLAVESATDPDELARAFVPAVEIAGSAAEALRRASKGDAGAGDRAAARNAARNAARAGFKGGESTAPVREALRAVVSAAAEVVRAVAALGGAHAPSGHETSRILRGCIRESVLSWVAGAGLDKAGWRDVHVLGSPAAAARRVCALWRAEAHAALIESRGGRLGAAAGSAPASGSAGGFASLLTPSAAQARARAIAAVAAKHWGPEAAAWSWGDAIESISQASAETLSLDAPGYALGRADALGLAGIGPGLGGMHVPSPPPYFAHWLRPQPTDEGTGELCGPRPSCFEPIPGSATATVAQRVAEALDKALSMAAPGSAPPAHLASAARAVLHPDVVRDALASSAALCEPGGSCLLVAPPGSGRRTAVALAAALAGATLVPAPRRALSSATAMKDELRAPAREAAVRDEPRWVVLDLGEPGVAPSALAETHATLLAGKPNGLFARDELESILAEIATQESAGRDGADANGGAAAGGASGASAAGVGDAASAAAAAFRGGGASRAKASLDRRLSRNLHLVFLAAPGPELDAALRGYPSLAHRAKVVTLGEWPQKALRDIASRRLASDASDTDPLASNGLETEAGELLGLEAPKLVGSSPAGPTAIPERKRPVTPEVGGEAPRRPPSALSDEEKAVGQSTPKVGDLSAAEGGGRRSRAATPGGDDVALGPAAKRAVSRSASMAPSRAVSSPPTARAASRRPSTTAEGARASPLPQVAASDAASPDNPVTLMRRRTTQDVKEGAAAGSRASRSPSRASSKTASPSVAGSRRSSTSTPQIGSAAGGPLGVARTPAPAPPSPAAVALAAAAPAACRAAARLHSAMRAGAGRSGLPPPSDAAFLDLVDAYGCLSSARARANRSRHALLAAGLSRLDKAKAEAARLGAARGERAARAADAARRVEALLPGIEETRRAAEKERVIVERVVSRVEAEAAACASKREEAERDLAAALPALQAAEAALQGVKQQDVAALKSLRKPPAAVRLVLDAVLLLRQGPLRPTAWSQGEGASRTLECSFDESSRMAADPGFLAQLSKFPRDRINDETIELLSPYLSAKDLSDEAVRRASTAVAGLARWARGMAEYHAAAKIFRPRSIALRDAERTLRRAEAERRAAEKQLAAAQGRLDEASSRLAAAAAERDMAESEIREAERAAAAAAALGEALGGEEARWRAQAAEADRELARTPARCLAAAALTAYGGPLGERGRETCVKLAMRLAAAQGLEVERGSGSRAAADDDDLGSLAGNARRDVKFFDALEYLAGDGVGEEENDDEIAAGESVEAPRPAPDAPDARATTPGAGAAHPATGRSVGSAQTPKRTGRASARAKPVASAASPGATNAARPASSGDAAAARAKASFGSVLRVFPGLPSDRASGQAGALATAARRPPLLLDPEGQGQRWLRSREGESLLLAQASDPGLSRVIESALRGGRPVLVEGVGADPPDAVLATLAAIADRGGMGSGRWGGAVVEGRDGNEDEGAFAGEHDFAGPPRSSRGGNLGTARDGAHTAGTITARAGATTALGTPQTGRHFAALPVATPISGVGFGATSKTREPPSVRLDSVVVDAQPGFAVYLATSLPLALLPPSLLSRTWPVDFTLTLKGLEERLLDLAASRELPALAKRLEQVKAEVRGHARRARAMEKDLLERLGAAEGEALADPALAAALGAAARGAEEAAKAGEDAKAAAAALAVARDELRPLARVAAALHGAARGVARLGPLYAAPPEEAEAALLAALSAAEPSPLLARRADDARRRLLLLAHERLRRGVSRQHRGVAELLQAAAVCEVDGAVWEGEMEMLLGGGGGASRGGGGDAALKRQRAPRRPRGNWPPQDAWDAIVALSHAAPAFAPLPAVLAAESTGSGSWHQWATSLAPEEQPLPSLGGALGLGAAMPNDPSTLSASAAMLQQQIVAGGGGGVARLSRQEREREAWMRLLLCKALRPDRVPQAGRRLAAAVLGQGVLDPPAPTPASVLRDAPSPTSPILCVVTPGSDPGEAVRTLALKSGKALAEAALGRGREPAARRAVEIASRAGAWALLSNVHLCPAFCEELGRWLERATPADGFRLWLTAEVAPGISERLLRRSTRLCLDASEGLRDGFRDALLAAAEVGRDVAPPGTEEASGAGDGAGGPGGAGADGAGGAGAAGAAAAAAAAAPRGGALVAVMGERAAAAEAAEELVGGGGEGYLGVYPSEPTPEGGLETPRPRKPLADPGAGGAVAGAAAGAGTAQASGPSSTAAPGKGTSGAEDGKAGGSGASGSGPSSSSAAGAQVAVVPSRTLRWPFSDRLDDLVETIACYLHAAVRARRAIGPAGWGDSYEFGKGLLEAAIDAAHAAAREASLSSDGGPASSSAAMQLNTTSNATRVGVRAGRSSATSRFGARGAGRDARRREPMLSTDAMGQRWESLRAYGTLVPYGAALTSARDQDVLGAYARRLYSTESLMRGPGVALRGDAHGGGGAGGGGGSGLARTLEVRVATQRDAAAALATLLTPDDADDASAIGMRPAAGDAARAREGKELLRLASVAADETKETVGSECDEDGGAEGRKAGATPGSVASAQGLAVGQAPAGLLPAQDAQSRPTPTSLTAAGVVATATGPSRLEAALTLALEALPATLPPSAVRSGSADAAPRALEAVRAAEVAMLNAAFARAGDALTKALKCVRAGGAGGAAPLASAAPAVADVIRAVSRGRVPDAWVAWSWRSDSLSEWLDAGAKRREELRRWCESIDPAGAPPGPIWLGGLSRPSAFLLAIAREGARRAARAAEGDDERDASLDAIDLRWEPAPAALGAAALAAAAGRAGPAALGGGGGSGGGGGAGVLGGLQGGGSSGAADGSAPASGPWDGSAIVVGVKLSEVWWDVRDSRLVTDASIHASASLPPLRVTAVPRGAATPQVRATHLARVPLYASGARGESNLVAWLPLPTDVHPDVWILRGAAATLGD